MTCLQDPAAPASPWTLDSRFAGKPAKALSPAKQLARQAALQGEVREASLHSAADADSIRHSFMTVHRVTIVCDHVWLWVLSCDIR